jgi:hypothetical protein
MADNISTSDAERLVARRNSRDTTQQRGRLQFIGEVGLPTATVAVAITIHWRWVGSIQHVQLRNSMLF